MSENTIKDSLSPISSSEESSIESYGSEDLEAAESPTLLDQLPSAVKRRVFALKKLQFGINQIEEEFVFAFLELQKKFEPKYETLFEKRKQIICGDYEPLDSDLAEGYAIDAVPTDVKGVPDFWLIVLLRSEDISPLIEEYDENILKHLVDIRNSYDIQHKKVSIEFQFSPNDYFENQVLTKQIYLSSDPQRLDVIHPMKCESTSIEWKDGKDVTQEVTIATPNEQLDSQLKTIRHKKSFFRFFSTSSPNESSDDLDLELDWDLAKELTTNVIPNAVLYFTGDLGLPEEGFDGEDNESEPEEDESEIEEEED